MAIARRMYVFVTVPFLLLAGSGSVEGQSGDVTCWWCLEVGEGEEVRHGFSLGGELCGLEGKLNGHAGSTQCARCGWKSECHYEFLEGPCHRACGPAGDAVAALTEIQQALETGDIALVASALFKKRTGVSVEFIPKGGRIDLLLPCDPDKPYQTIPIPPEERYKTSSGLLPSPRGSGVAPL